MTTARLVGIQRDLGLDPVVIGKPGRPGTYTPVAVAPHWTAVRSSAANPHPSLAVVRDGRRGLPGPLYGDLIPWQDNPTDLQVIQITVGRTNNLGMCHRPTVLAAGRGATIARRPPPDTGGGNHLVDAVSADYHPIMGPPPAAMVEAMVRAIAARLIYRGLPAHAVLDHAQATRRKIDLLDHWPQPDEMRARVADVMRHGAPPAVQEDDMIRKNDGPTQYIRSFQFALNRFFTDTGGEPSTGWLIKDGVAGDQTFDAAWEAVERLSTPQPGFAGTAQIDLRGNGISGPEVLEREGIDPVLVAAIVGAAAIR